MQLDDARGLIAALGNLAPELQAAGRRRVAERIAAGGVVDLAAGRVYRFKHGWIPLTHAAALQQAHGNHVKAREAMARHHGAGWNASARPKVRTSSRTLASRQPSMGRDKVAKGFVPQAKPALATPPTRTPEAAKNLQDAGLSVGDSVKVGRFQAPNAAFSEAASPDLHTIVRPARNGYVTVRHEPTGTTRDVQVSRLAPAGRTRAEISTAAARNAAVVRGFKGKGKSPEADRHLEGLAVAMEAGNADGVRAHAERLDTTEAHHGAGTDQGVRPVATQALVLSRKVRAAAATGRAQGVAQDRHRRLEAERVGKEERRTLEQQGTVNAAKRARMESRGIRPAGPTGPDETPAAIRRREIVVAMSDSQLEAAKARHDNPQTLRFIEAEQAKRRTGPAAGAPAVGQEVHVASDLRYHGKYKIDSVDPGGRTVTVSDGTRRGRASFDQLFSTADAARANVKSSDGGGLAALGGNAYARKAARAGGGASVAQTPREIHDRLQANPSSVTMDELQRLSALGGRFAAAANAEIGRRDGPAAVWGHQATPNYPAGSPAPADAGKRVQVEHSGDGTLLTIDRGDTAAREAAKAAGFKWSGNLGSWYLPRSWSESTRRAKVEQMQARVGAEHVHVADAGRGVTTTAAEREAAARAHAASRAEHMDAKAAKLAAESDARDARARAISDHIPLGQPILVGHHSESRHRSDIRKIQSNTQKSWEADVASKAAAQSAENARRTAAGDDPLKRQRRIDKNQAELRAIDRKLETQRILDKAPTATKYDHLRISPDYVQRLTEQRAQLVDQIDHDKAQIAAAGHQAVTAAHIKPGDTIHYRGRTHVVKKVNKTTVSVPTGYSWDDKVPINQITKHVPKGSQ